MSLHDISGIMNLVGLALALVFWIPWRGRPPMNVTIGYIGFAIMFVAAIGTLTHFATCPIILRSS